MQKPGEFVTNRYSDEDLKEFRLHVEKKLENDKKELAHLEEQIQNLTETMESDGDWMDDTSNSSNLEMLATMVSRTKHHIRDLENALIRIQNKSYGICTISGFLIDKRRLMAVPTTTKSLEAKNALAAPKPKEKKSPASLSRKPAERKIISRIISKPQAIKPSDIIDDDDEEDDDDFEKDFTDLDLKDIELDD